VRRPGGARVRPAKVVTSLSISGGDGAPAFDGRPPSTRCRWRRITSPASLRSGGRGPSSERKEARTSRNVAAGSSRIRGPEAALAFVYGGPGRKSSNRSSKSDFLMRSLRSDRYRAIQPAASRGNVNYGSGCHVRGMSRPGPGGASVTKHLPSAPCRSRPANTTTPRFRLYGSGTAHTRHSF